MTTETEAPASAPVADSTPAPAPTRDEKIQQIAKEMSAEGNSKSVEADDSAPETTPAPKAEAKPEEKQDTVSSAFTKIAAEKAEARKLREEAKAQLERVKAYDELAQEIPVPALRNLVGALRAGDVKAVIRTLGISAEDIQKAISGAATPEVRQEPKDTAPSLERLREELKAELRKELYSDPELAEIKQERQQQKFQTLKSQALDLVKSTLKDSKELSLLSGLDAHEQVLQVLENYQTQHGSLPSDDPKEAIFMAAKLVEERLAAEKAKWERVLTRSQGKDTVQDKAAELASGPRETRTLTNGLTAPSGGPSTAKSREDRIRELIESKVLDF